MRLRAQPEGPFRDLDTGEQVFQGRAGAAGRAGLDAHFQERSVDRQRHEIGRVHQDRLADLLGDLGAVVPALELDGQWE